MNETLIHFYRRGGQPFQSLTALPEDEALRLMGAYYIAGSALWERFKDPLEYLSMRRTTEAWLHAAFIAKGGRPQQPNPIYMVLGMTPWLHQNKTSVTLAHTAELEVPLTLFAEDEVSFTYPDSMVSLFLAREQNPAYYLPEIHGRIFTLPEIRALLAEHGAPGAGLGDNLPPDLANYIEVQVWNCAPLLNNAGLFSCQQRAASA
jgi:hypothetical protein